MNESFQFIQAAAKQIVDQFQSRHTNVSTRIERTVGQRHIFMQDTFDKPANCSLSKTNDVAAITASNVPVIESTGKEGNSDNQIQLFAGINQKIEMIVVVMLTGDMRIGLWLSSD